MFVITGGGSGIGRALAHALASRDKSVLIIGRNEANLIQTSNFSSLIHYFVADIATHQGRADLVKKINNKKLEGLVHNAGIIDPIAPIDSLNELSWNHCIETNLNAPQFLNQLLLTQLKAGRVLHIGSGAAYFAIKGWSAYCVSKAALSMLTRCWQLESEDVAFASVMPGIVDTDMQTLIRNSAYGDPKKQEFFKELKREGRLLSTETVASFIVWLLLDLDKVTFQSQEWDIYDKSHHIQWLFPPHNVFDLEE